ncbi:PAS domain S-box protein [Marinilabiliaceae bacterium ANBcel2]|nr:PAS domain S-box protein [Marinilabiliaceae bacterium ANBcel2]
MSNLKRPKPKEAELLKEIALLKSELKKERTKASKTKTFLDEIIISAPVGVVILKNGIVEYINNHFSKVLGFSTEEIKGEKFSNYCVYDKENSRIDKFLSTLDKSSYDDTNICLSSKNGANVHMHITAAKTENEKEYDYYLLIARDLTRIKRIEKYLIESEERNRKVIETNIDGIFIISDSGRLIYVNKAGYELTGYEKNELKEVGLEKLFPKTDGLPAYFNIIRRLRKGDDYRGDNVLQHNMGDRLHVEIYGTSIHLDGNRYYYFSIHDITKRKINEKALMLSEKKFRSLSENLPDCILRINDEGLITYGNTIFKKLFSIKNPNYLYAIDELPLTHPGYFIAAFQEVLATKKIKTFEIEQEYKNRVITLDISFSPELNEKGEFVSVLGIGRDISKRKRIEKELILEKEKAEAADKLKSAFLANMSHEIRTPLNAIVGFSNLLGSLDPDSADREQFVSVINKSADNLMALINDIIDIAKIESGYMIVNKSLVNLNEVLISVFNTYSQTININHKGKIDFKLNIPAKNDKESLYIYADQIRVVQVINNLMDNALKFTHKGYIELGYRLYKNKVYIYVKDTGIGITEHKQALIFEAFRQEDESTSKKYGGTGLGLSICKKLVEAMGGKMGLRSKKWEGSEFYFSLNRHNEEIKNENKEEKKFTKVYSSFK